MRALPALALSATLAAFASSLAAPARADEAEELAKKLSNPIADLMSFPLQLNYDEEIGPAGDGERWQLNFQPVLPFSLNADWNLISRTIIPLIDQDDILPGGAADESGLGDVVQSLFFSPVRPTAGGWIWGAGPVFLLPTASDDVLGAEQWGLGPTAVLLRQQGGLTYGGLFNHIESVAGDDDRADVSNTFLQPFVSYTTKGAWTFSLNTESTYDWENKQWSVPVNAGVSRLVRLGKRGIPFSFGGTLRYWAESPDGGPEGLGYRVTVTMLLPKKKS